MINILSEDFFCKIEVQQLKCNASFGLIQEPFSKPQHPNQQEGLDLYVVVVDFTTHEENEVKLYETSKGLYFKKNGKRFYLADFTSHVAWIPSQLIELD